MASDNKPMSSVTAATPTDCGCPCGRHWLPIEEEFAKRIIKKCSEPCCFLSLFRIPDHWYGRHAIHSIYFFCTLLLSLSLIAAVYVWFVLCSRCVQFWNYRETECLIQHVNINTTSFCGCHQDGLPEGLCVNNFTCVNIIAWYNVEGLGNVTSQLYETAEDLYWAPPSDLHCSFHHVCDDITERRHHINKALHHWAYTNNSLQCRYDPYSPGHVFLYPGSYARNVLIFGAVNIALIVFCVCVMLITFTTCGWRYIWARHAPDGIKTEVEQWRCNSDVCGSIAPIGACPEGHVTNQSQSDTGEPEGGKKDADRKTQNDVATTGSSLLNEMA